MIPLKQIHIPTPCEEAWGGMAGDDQSRFCDNCAHHVHNLSEMSRADAQELLNRAEDRLCVRFVPDANGVPLTREDLAVVPTPVKRLPWPRRWAAAASWGVALLMTGAGMARAAVSPKHAPSKSAKAGTAQPKRPLIKPHVAPPPPPTHTMGVVIVPTVTTVTPALPRPLMGKIAVPTKKP